MKKIKILIAEDHRIVREGLISRLKDQENIQIVAEASDGKEAVEKAIEFEPDIILMDISMPELNGIEASKILQEKLPTSKILILTAHDEEEYILELVKSGVKGYVLKDISSTELVDAIEKVYNGETYFGPQAAKIVVKNYIENIDQLKKDRDPILSPREVEVLRFLADGYSNKEVGEKLNLSVKTINTYRESIMKKLNIRSIAGLTRYAVEKGILRISNL
jgi:two-component system nitrate/nitrite response regulator NarL